MSSLETERPSLKGLSGSAHRILGGWVERVRGWSGAIALVFTLATFGGVFLVGYVFNNRCRESYPLSLQPEDCMTIPGGILVASALLFAALLVLTFLLWCLWESLRAGHLRLRRLERTLRPPLGSVRDWFASGRLEPDEYEAFSQRVSRMLAGSTPGEGLLVVGHALMAAGTLLLPFGGLTTYVVIADPSREAAEQAAFMAGNLVFGLAVPLFFLFVGAPLVIQGRRRFRGAIQRVERDLALLARAAHGRAKTGPGPS